MNVYMSPSKLSLCSDLDQSLPSVVHPETVKQKSSNSVLYKTLSPRKKFDKFGLDLTDYRAYCLSSTVFPTAVKTTLLGDLQDSKAQACGFDIVERPAPSETVSLHSCAASVVNAPPPTAVTSQRSIQSAPIVAFVEVNLSEMPGSGSTTFSVVSKSPGHSQVNGEVMAINSVNVSQGPCGDSDHNLVTGVDPSADQCIQEGQVETGMERQNADGCHSGLYKNSGTGSNKSRMERTSTNWSDNTIQTTSLKSSSPRVASYSRFEEGRLTRYQWKSRQTRQEEDQKNGGDIRDVMYLNTFCPGERPVRFNKISLPRISRTPRQRPWTVSETNVSARIAALTFNKSNSRRDTLLRQVPSRSCNVPVRRKLTGSVVGEVTKSASHGNPRQVAWRDSIKVQAVDEDKENAGGDLDTKPLLEIRSFLSSDAVGDQREKLKGRNGCLNSRVKQCVRFVRYRERLDRQDDARPMTSEHGKYRPISTLDVREHNVSNPAPTPELKLQQSVETYQQYVETIARQTNLTSSNSFSYRGGGSNTASCLSRMRAPVTASSTNFESGDSKLAQSMLDSNRPDTLPAGLTRTSIETPRPQNSAIYTKDVSAVGQALDIKRISPVPTVNRVVPGTRGVIQRTGSPRVISARSEDTEGHGGESVPNPPSPIHGDAIVVPMATKSECPSEYSVSKDD